MDRSDLAGLSDSADALMVVDMDEFGAETDEAPEMNQTQEGVEDNFACFFQVELPPPVGGGFGLYAQRRATTHFRALNMKLDSSFGLLHGCPCCDAVAVA